MSTLQTTRLPTSTWDPEPDDEGDGPYCGLDDSTWRTR